MAVRTGETVKKGRKLRKQSGASQSWNFLAFCQSQLQKFGCSDFFRTFSCAGLCTSLFCALLEFNLIVSLLISVSFSFHIYNVFCIYLFQYLLFNAKFLFTVLLDCSASPSYLQKEHFQLLFIPTECCSDLVFFEGVFLEGRRGRCFLFGVFSSFFLVLGFFLFVRFFGVFFRVFFSFFSLWVFLWGEG